MMNMHIKISVLGYTATLKRFTSWYWYHTQSTVYAVLTHLHLPSCLRESCPNLSFAVSFQAQNAASKCRHPSSSALPQIHSKPLVGARTAGQDATLFPWDKALRPLSGRLAAAIWFWGAGIPLGSWSPLSQNTPLHCRGSLPFLLFWKSGIWQVFVLSRNTLTPDEGLGLVYTAGYLTALISPSHRTDTVISDKGKICLERD